MDPFADSPTLLALRTARDLLETAQADLMDAVRTARAVAPDTDWRSRSAEQFHASIEALADDLVLLGHRITAADGDIADAQQRAVAAQVARWG
jgi:hypothetical protein